jgi:hypothetical protein
MILLLWIGAFALTYSHNEYLKYANPFFENPNCQLITNGHLRMVGNHTKPEQQNNNS